MLIGAMREYRFVRNTSLIELENFHELETDSALYQNVSLVLADHSYSTGSAQIQTSSPHSLFFDEDTEIALRFVSNVMLL